MRLFRRLRSFHTVWPLRRFSIPWRLQRSRQSRRSPLKRLNRDLGSQSLEPRLALAFSTFDTVTLPLATAPGMPMSPEATTVDSRALSPAELYRAMGDDPSILIGRTPGIDTIIHQVFAPTDSGSSTFSTLVDSIEQRLLAGTSSLGVSFRLVEPSVIGNHGGAYSPSTPDGPTIYLRSDLLSAPQSVLRSVVFEELGHHLDTMLNHGVDTRGDEGELFSDLVLGFSPSSADHARLLAEVDHGTIAIDGRTVDVEFHTVGGVARSLKYVEGDAPLALQPNVVLTRNSGRGNLAPNTITSVELTIPSASSTDRIGVAGAASSASLDGVSPLAEGIAVPTTVIPKTDFWMPAPGGKSTRFAYAMTPSGKVTFTATGLNGPDSTTAFQSLIRAIRYDSTADAPSTIGRLFAWSIGSVVSATGAPLAPRTFGGTVSITPVNNAPSVAATSTPADLVEAGAVDQGVSSSSVKLAKSDVDSTSVRYDTTWMRDNGWTSADGGLTYTAKGTYGTATLTVATDTVTYLIDDTLAATDDLDEGDVEEDRFVVQVIDTGVTSRRSSGKPQTARKELEFRVTGKADFQTFGDATTSVTYTENGAPVFLQPEVSLRRNSGSGSNAPETITSLALTISEPASTDRIRVKNAKGNAAGSVDSPLGSGISVPGVATPSIDFWLSTGSGSSDRFTYSVTPDGVYTFTAPATAGRSSYDAFESLMQSVQYDSTSEAPDANPRQLSWTLERKSTERGSPLPSRKLVETVAIGPVNDAPTVAAGPASNDLVESTSTVTGTDTATVVLTKSDVDGATVGYDDAWLASNGWISTDGGITFLRTGTYGTASLDVTTDTVSYLLDDTLATTDALIDGESVSDPFVVRVKDDQGAGAEATFSFVVLGTTDAPKVSASAASNALVEAGSLVTGINSATAAFSLSSVDSTVAIDTAWLAANGWITADLGLTYSATGTYGTATLDIATATITYLLDDARAATDALAEGQAVSEVFAIQVLAASGLTAQASATFDITGSADAPVVTAAPASNALVEAGALVLGVNTATAAFTFSSVDSTVAIDTAWLEANGWITADLGLTYSATGTYGTATLDIATATITYLLDDARAATDALAEGQAVSEVFAIRVLAASGLTAQASATFDITGSTEVNPAAPTVSASAASNALVEAGSVVIGVNTATAAFTFSSVNSTVAIDTLWLAANGWITADLGLTYSAAGTYGTATLDVATATITYLLDDTLAATDALADEQAVFEKFTVRVIDATGLTAQASATFDITGSADTPVVTAAPASNALIETGALVLGVNTATAAFTFSSVDSTVAIDTAWLAANGWITADLGLTYSATGTYGTATLDIATATITYLLDDARAATDALAEGQAVSEVFAVQVLAANGLTAQASATFDVTGRNDGPLLIAAAASNQLVEAGVFLAGVNTATVALTSSDVDGTVTFDVPWLELFGWNTADGGLTYTHGGDFGDATLDMTTGVLSYLLLDALAVTDGLITGETVLDAFAIQVIDNSGATAEATAVFTINGTDTPSAFTANVAGYASVASANPTAATLGIVDPANTLVVSIPADVGVISILNVQWEWFDINANAWVRIPGATSLSYMPREVDAIPAGSVLHAVAEYTDATGTKIITSVDTAPLGREMVGTALNDAFFGTAFQDVLYGGAGNDTLDGNANADSMAGGTGNDTYVVDDAGDVVVEFAGEGIDTIQSAVSWTLGDTVENLTLTGLATIDGTGNALDNEIIGNGLNNILTGGLGADTLTGGTGVDTFFLASLGDSLAGSMDTITDFAVGVDILDAPTPLPRNRIAQIADAGTFSTATLEFLLTPTTLLANRGAMVTFGGSTTESYLVLNDGVAGYNAATDAVILIRYTGRITRFIVS